MILIEATGKDSLICNGYSEERSLKQKCIFFKIAFLETMSFVSFVARSLKKKIKLSFLSNISLEVTSK
jgi:hypothetical protein